MLADVADFDLESGRVGRHIGQDAALIHLHQHLIQLAADRRFGPVGFADRTTAGVEPGIAQLGGLGLAVDIDRPLAVQEGPERAGDIVLGGGVEIGDLCAGHHAHGRVVAHRAVAPNRGGDHRAHVVGSRVVAQRGVADPLHGLIGRRVHFAVVTGNRDTGGGARQVVRYADLLTPRNQFDGQQAIGDKEGIVGLTVGVVQLHAALIKILHQAQTAGRLAVGFQQAGTIRSRSPVPGAGGGVVGDRQIGALPNAAESRVGKTGAGLGGRRGLRDNQPGKQCGQAQRGNTRENPLLCIPHQTPPCSARSQRDS